jgi:transposase-like protein
VETRKVAQGYRLTEWARIIKGRTDSEMSVKAYCESLGIRQNVYYYWQKKLREVAVKEFEKQSKNPSLPQLVVEKNSTVFSEVQTMPPGYMNAAAITVRIGEAVIEIQNGADTDTVESVLEILKRL